MTESTVMEALLTAIGSVFTQIITWVGTVCETVVTTPLLQLGLAFVVIGFVVGIIKRLISVR